MSDILPNLVSLVFVIGAGGGATYWIVRYVNATIDQSEVRIVQYQQLREEMSKNFEQLRQENARTAQENAQAHAKAAQENAQAHAKAAQENAQAHAKAAQENAQANARAMQENARANEKAAQENAQRFARLEEMIRNLQPPRGGVGGSSESSDEKPGANQ